MHNLIAWQRAPESLDLRSGVAEVWQFRTSVTAPALTDLMAELPSAERQRAERIRHEGARRGFVVARSRLRHLLGRYLGVAGGSLAFQYTAAGKPELDPAVGGGLHFSLAHSGDVAVVAFARDAVGVDVERMRPVPRADRIARRVFARTTCALLETLTEPELWPAFFAAWTQREALVKALGVGLLATIDPPDLEWPAGLAPRQLGGADHAARWTIAQLPVETPFSAALVVAGDIGAIRLFRLDE